MFTGIIATIGTIEVVEEIEGSRRFTIRAPSILADAVVGDSVAVDGVCLTATAVHPERFVCEAVAETLDRTTLGTLAPGSSVNLERPMPADGRFDGHIVQGHVDGVGTIRSVSVEGDARRYRCSIPAGLDRYVVEKGSIAVDGTSLTVTAVNPVGEEGWFEVVLIPHTLEHTVLGAKSSGDRVNLEMDVFAKYVERITEMRT